MKQIKILYLAALLLVFPILINAQSETGCCTNPEADNSFICADSFVTSSQCCADNYITCLNNENLFKRDTPCGTVDACQTQGCCCSSRPTTITTQAECSAPIIPHDGSESCNDLCGIPQCEDLADNDNDGCFDAADPDCQISNTESNDDSGSCIDLGKLNCNHKDYNPKITVFNAEQVKGQKKISLTWNTECTSDPVNNHFYYELFRCEGQGCSTFSQITTTTQTSFNDEDSQLKSDTTYTYKLQAHYSIQTASPSSVTAETTGHAECLNRFDSSTFCISSQNKAYSCNDNNALNEVLACSGGNVCIISGGNPQCIEPSACDPSSGNLFGLFSEQQTCENGEYCFYDRSVSIVDSCFQCNPDMTCNDYKSSGSCGRNNCNVGNCQWQSLSDELGTGVCVDLNTDNCEFCNVQPTSRTTNEVFEQCTTHKIELLSVAGNVCNYDGQSGKACQDVICTDYLPENNCVDTCNLGICHNFNGVCKKDGDNDGNADCPDGDELCENDIFPPITTIIPLIEGGKAKELLIQIFDKTKSIESYVKVDSENYTTFLCNNALGECARPFQIFTNKSNLRIFDLEVYELGTNIFDLKKGQNILKYYSQDPAKNLGLTKEVRVFASNGTSGPAVIPELIEITGANLVDNIYYTKETKPTITIEFHKEAEIILARLIPKDGGTPINLIYDGNFSKTFTFTLPADLDPGEYTLEINARDENGVLMEEMFRLNLVIDNTEPQLVSIEPESGTLITDSSLVTVTVVFDEPVTLESVTINGEDFSDLFSTQDGKTYTATLNLEDGIQEIVVEAIDPAGNRVIIESEFVVNKNPKLKIRIIEPSFGVSPVYVFDLIIGTDNAAECKYSLNLDLDEYDNMLDFSSSTGTTHTKLEFNEIEDGNKETQKLFVRCIDTEYDEETKKTLDLTVDPDNPKIIVADANPNPVVEIPRNTTLKIQTDKDSICKYSSQSQNFEEMESKFHGFDDNSFRISHLQDVVVESDGEYSFFAACRSKSELVSETATISFSSDTSIPLIVTSHTPPYSDKTTVTLDIRTNKKSECFSGTDSRETSQKMAGETYGHTKTLRNLNEGEHKYYVVCVSGNETSEPLEIRFTVDISPPAMVYVNDTSTLPDNPESTWRLDMLRAKWLGIDNETSVSSYQYTLAEFGTSKILINWTSIFNKEDQWVFLPETGEINLSSGSKYFFTFKAKNIMELFSTIMKSDGITIDPSLKPTDCSNNVKDPLESDVDCGGPCSLCREGLACGENIDCASGFCAGTHLCKLPTCSDTALNQDESDVDCGGNRCTSCEISKTCNTDSDCTSGSCSFGVCEEVDACEDGILSGTETDVDCGGACLIKCSTGKSCQTGTDCSNNLICADQLCSTDIPDDERDTDGDGIPDVWEIANGLDPNDPSDAGKDEDKDGLSNLFEYTKNLNPNKADTDGDGFSDKVELDKGTDPLDPKSKPKSALGTILLILLLIVILAGAGYGAYYYYEKNMKKPKPHPSLRTPTTKQQIPIAKPTAKKTASTETFRKREEEKKQKRGKQFEVFGKKEAKEKKPLVSKSKVVKEASKPKKPKVSKAKLISKKDEKASKAKGEDTIRKLREIASKKKSRKAKKRKT